MLLLLVVNQSTMWICLCKISFEAYWSVEAGTQRMVSKSYRKSPCDLSFKFLEMKRSMLNENSEGSLENTIDSERITCCAYDLAFSSSMKPWHKKGIINSSLS